MEENTIIQILEKIKPNKMDLSSVTIYTQNANIFLQVEKIYFSTNYNYTLIIEYYKNNNRETTITNNKSEIIKILKKFELIKVEI